MGQFFLRWGGREIKEVGEIREIKEIREIREIREGCLVWEKVDL